MRMNKNIRFIDIRGYYNYLGAHKSYIWCNLCKRKNDALPRLMRWRVLFIIIGFYIYTELFHFLLINLPKFYA